MPYSQKSIKRQKRNFLIFIILTAVLLVLTGVLVFYTVSFNNKKAEAEIEAERIVIPEGLFAEPEITAFDYTFIRSMKGIKLTPTVDFMKGSVSEADISKELDEIIGQVKALKFNSLIVDTKYKDGVIFNTEALKSTKVDVLKLITEKAKKAGLSVSVVFHANGIKSEAENWETHVNFEERENLAQAAADLAEYEIDAVIIDGVEAALNGGNYKNFISYGYDGNADEWLKENVELTVEKISRAVKERRNSIPVGLYVNNVWANKESNPQGSETQAGYQMLYDGNIDAKALIENGFVDFINVKATASMSNSSANFQTVVSWWGKLCSKKNIPLYVTHCGELVNTDEAEGWNGTDELAQQVATALKEKSYHGSAFSGLSRLVENPNGSTDILLMYYNDEYSEEELFQGLEISSPSARNFVTYENMVQFRGKFDANQEVLLNGEKVVTSERGGFSTWVPLNVGYNEVTLEHKGDVIKYTIERKVHILKEVSPTKAMTVAGGSVIEINVIAYKGSSITAKINGETINLEVGGYADENDADSNYVGYQGKYKVPKSTDEEQPIGSIKIYGSYQGYSESETGSAITIAKLPDAVDPDALTGQILAHATINQTYANTYPFNTASGYPQAILYQLPYGTTDIIESYNGDFINLRSGITVHSNAVSVDTFAFEGNNAVTEFSAGVEGNDTVIRATMNWRSPFTLIPSPYPSDPKETYKNYYFNANKITVLLDYVTRMDEDRISNYISDSPVFSGMTMERVFNEERGIYQYKIELSLAQTGKYYGCHARWEDNTLVLKFNHPAYGSLSGTTIVVDAGHGGKDKGTTAGRDVYEKEVNLIMAEKVRDELESYGATVIMTRTGDEDLSLEERVAIAHAYEADMFISCHHNSNIQNLNAKGVETYFNAPFSQPLASAVQNRLGQYLDNRGAKSSHPEYNFIVTRERQYPSILIEFGFLSNAEEEQVILDSNHQDNMARAVAEGVLDYFS